MSIEEDLKGFKDHDDWEAQKKKRAEEGEGTTLHESAIHMGELYVELKEMGVDKENILDLIRIVFMFAGPTDPQKVAQAIAPEPMNREQRRAQKKGH